MHVYYSIYAYELARQMRINRSFRRKIWGFVVSTCTASKYVKTAVDEDLAK
jgi:hypothetical protein